MYKLEIRELFREQFAPYPLQHYKENYVQVVREIFGGFSVAMTLVGEGIAFAFILHVEPQVALHASWIVALVVGVLGSRMALISGADGVRAAALGPFIQMHGVVYLFPIVIFMSILFCIASIFNLMQFVRLVPTTVMTGFVNGLALIIFISQVDHLKLKDHSHFLEGATLYWMLFEIALTVIVSVILKRIPKVGPVLPTILIAMGICTIFDSLILEKFTEWRTPHIGDVATISDGPPIAFWLDPKYYGKLPAFSWETFVLILSPSITTAGACFLETVMTMEVVDDLTHTTNTRPRQQIYAYALANCLAGLLGCMGGAALVPESVFNCVIGGADGKHRISAIMSGLMVMVFVFAAQDFIRIIPTAAIVGVMLIVVFHTFDWASLPIVLSSFLPHQLRTRVGLLRSRKVTRFDAAVIVITTVVVVLVNLFVAVLVGVLFTSVAIVWHTGNQLQIIPSSPDADTRVYVVEGPLCFSAAKKFVKSFQIALDPPKVVIEFQGFGVMLQDYTAIHTLNVVGKNYKDAGKLLIVRGLDDLSLKRLQKADVLRTHFSVHVPRTKEDYEVIGDETRLTLQTDDLTDNLSEVSP